MAKKEAKTDLWVYNLLKEANVNLEPQGSSIKEIDNALKTASKSGTGNVGFPEYVGTVKDFILIIEEKSDLSNHIKLDDKGNISTKKKDVKDYAVNGALFYGQHLARNTTYKKIIAFGIYGNEKNIKLVLFILMKQTFIENFQKWNPSYLLMKLILMNIIPEKY